MMPLKKRLEIFWTVLGYEQLYDAYKDTISSLASVLAARDLRMMVVLKGYALSLDWLVSEHRRCGDIDIWIFSRYQEGGDDACA